MLLCICMFFFSSLTDAMLNLPCIFVVCYCSRVSHPLRLEFLIFVEFVGERDWTKVVERFVWFFLFCIRKFYWIERENNEEEKKPTTTLNNNKRVNQMNSIQMRCQSSRIFKQISTDRQTSTCSLIKFAFTVENQNYNLHLK